MGPVADRVVDVIDEVADEVLVPHDGTETGVR